MLVYHYQGQLDSERLKADPFIELSVWPFIGHLIQHFDPFSCENRSHGDECVVSFRITFFWAEEVFKNTRKDMGSKLWTRESIVKLPINPPDTLTVSNCEPRKIEIMKNWKNSNFKVFVIQTSTEG